ncbi:MAG: hypothetical protein ABL868_06485 [Sulfuriferula sp.]
MQTLPTPTKPATRRAKAKVMLLTLWSVFEVLSIALSLFVFTFILFMILTPADWLPAVFTVVR